MRRAIMLALLALAQPAPARSPVYDRALEARVFDKAWRLVARHYWDQGKMQAQWPAARERYRAQALAAPDRQHFYTVLGEMLASLGDSHVYAIDPLQVAIGKARDAGQAADGFGVTMLPDDEGRWRVNQVRAGSSAAARRVQIGWEVRAVNGRPIDIDYQPAAGEAALFGFVDENGVAHDMRLTAALEAVLPARRATRLPGNVLLIGLDGFDPGADLWLRREIAAQRPRGLILDLRANDGGDADVIARVAGLFFSEDRPLVRRIAAHETIQRTRGAGDAAYRGPLALLIGRDSASGAEAIAALIDESGRGITIGARTAGALTGAAYYPLPDGGELAVAEFDIRTAGGKRLEGIGLAPRVAVTPSLTDRRAGRDPVLERARLLLARRAADGEGITSPGASPVCAPASGGACRAGGRSRTR